MSTAIDQKRITRAVLWNSALWTAGNALTTGGFLTYFAKELNAGEQLLSILMATPEFVGIVSVFTRPLIHRMGNRKHTWLTFSLVAWVIAMGIPLLAFGSLRPSGWHPVTLMIVCLAVWQGAQSIAFVAYMSWLSDLVPKHRWGRFFALRQIATLVILIVVPVAAGYARDWWQLELSKQQALWAYVAAFLLGIGLLLASLWPMLKIPNLPVRFAAQGSVKLRGIVAAWNNSQFRWLCGYSWWLAFWSGLTQVVVFEFLYGPLNLKAHLGTYFVLSSTMRLVQIPVCWVTGLVCDRRGNKTILIWGVLATAVAMLFFLRATSQQWWWVFGAYLMWGGWGSVNVAAPNLMLKLSPRSDNAAHIALFRHVAGLIAGVSGMIGAGWLHALKQSSSASMMIGGHPLDPFQTLFLVSLIGRALTICWILPIQEPLAYSKQSVST